MLWLCAAAALAAGCRTAGTSLTAAGDSQTPRMNVTMVPRQWEPPPAGDDAGEPAIEQAGGEKGTGKPDSAAEQPPGKNGLSRWWRDKKPPRMPRIPLPRTDLRKGDGDSDKAEGAEEDALDSETDSEAETDSAGAEFTL